ncbi:MAG TPA: alpha/beta fold hydrolase [Gemmatimonadaceae bacterium]|nr:alpha/beta fold hydrolase [Gemmatimonadaceae bacterium]
MIALCTGIEVAYDDVGAGEPVVFLHGFPHNRTLWAPQTGALVDRSRCIAPDLRGFGGSSVAPPFSIDQYADDVVALLDALRIERAVVAGLSMGGYVAFALWRRHRARVRALILADTRPGPDSDEARQKRRELIALARAKGSSAVAESMIPGMVGKSTREKNAGLVDAMYQMMQNAPVDGVVGALEAMIARPDSAPTLPTIDVPTLVVVGEEDALTPVSEARAMHAAIPSSRLEVLAGAGHVSNFERPAAFNHVVSEFLGMLQYA